MQKEQRARDVGMLLFRFGEQTIARFVYTIIMTDHPIHWLYNQFVGNSAQGDAICYLCGNTCSKQHSVIKSIADTFNSHYLARAPSSGYICDACHWYFNDKSHTEFRKMSLVVRRDSWQNWARETMKQDIIKWLTEGLEADSYLVVSLSKKKHILLQAPQNGQGSRELAIQVEEQVAHISLQNWQHMDNAFMSLLQLGHNKGEILSGDLYAGTLRKHLRLMEALKYSEQLEPWRKSPQIELLSYVTIFEKGQETIGTNGSIPEGIGDTADSGGTAQSRVERTKLGRVEDIQRDHLAKVRGKSSSVGTDHTQLSLFPE